ncbi:MAG TPA: FG-GAP repeat protein [Chitinophagaceae bacterium]
MKQAVLIITILYMAINSHSQVAINNNNANPAPSAMLEVSSTNKGVLIPRMTSAMRRSISNPEMGLLVFDTDRQTIYLFDGAKWRPMMVTVENKVPLISRTPEGAKPYADFGRSVDIYGDYAVVGAPMDTALNVDGGAAYIFAKENGTWVQQAKIYASNAASNDRFGSAVSIYGDVVVVGAPGKDISGINARGRVYVFKRNNRVWTQLAGLQASNGAANDNFGQSVSFNGQYLIVGAPFASVSGKQSAGSAYIFGLVNNVWTQKAILTSWDPVTDGQFGYSVDISGTTAVAGSPNAVVQGISYVGALYTFTNTDFNGNTWSNGQKIEPDIKQANMKFGHSFAIAGDLMIAGAPMYNFMQSTAVGRIVKYKRTNGVWSYSSYFASEIPDQQEGRCVALDGLNEYFSAPNFQGNYGRVGFSDPVTYVRFVFDEDPDATALFGFAIAAHNGQFIISAPNQGATGRVLFGIRE